MHADAIDVLVGRYRLERSALIDVPGHRVLQQDSVHRRVLR
jgi:hypothetical protein